LVLLRSVVVQATTLLWPIACPLAFRFSLCFGAARGCLVSFATRLALFRKGFRLGRSHIALWRRYLLAISLYDWPGLCCLTFGPRFPSASRRFITSCAFFPYMLIDTPLVIRRSCRCRRDTSPGLTHARTFWSLPHMCVVLSFFSKGLVSWPDKCPVLAGVRRSLGLLDPGHNNSLPSRLLDEAPRGPITP